ncbi:hypothetical protein IW249_006126 [Micromonospora vinacea]|uniref:Uncharacterized protein n=1 Tax=Micromonospora vinacea TaxID=709878 RepID=A0ABS0KAP0_9ACTN|nr:hypothetical protein [Micromonospora vinacea]
MTMNDQEQIARADVLRRMETAARTQVGLRSRPPMD